MERHPVPHNFMDVEFKLFGFFTVKQFGYLAVGFILALLLYYSEIPEILKYIFIAISIGGGIILAVVKINGQSAVIYFQNFVNSLFEPQERLWRKTPVVPEILQESKVETVTKAPGKEIDNALSRMRVANIPDQPLEKLSVEEEKLDKFEDDNLSKINEHFDFLFNQVPEIQGEKPQRTAQVAENTPPQNDTMYKKPETIADSITQDFKGEKLYEGSNYAVSFKPMTSRVNRPVDFNTSNPTAAVVKNNNIKLFLTGIVVDAFNQPVKSAKIDIIDLSGKLVRSLNSNADGRFELINQLPSGDYYLDISKPNFNFDRISVNIEEGKLLDLVIKAIN